MSFLLKDEAYMLLINMINEGKFVYDKTYSLNTLVAEMNMSKTPVRDAIQKLAEEKRIDILPSRGFKLHKMTREEMITNFHFSNAIEGYGVYRLAEAYQQDKRNKYVRHMRHLQEDMKQLLDSETSFGDYFTLDQQFHLEILESLGDDYFRSLQHSPMGFYGHPELQFGQKLSRQVIYNCHQNILDCICQGDPHGAYDAMLEHAKIMLDAL